MCWFEFCIPKTYNHKYHLAGLLTYPIPDRLPKRRMVQWLKGQNFYGFTAAGLFGIFTRFPFHRLLATPKSRSKGKYNI